MQENSRRTAFGRKGNNDRRSRIAFHATSFMVTETGHGLCGPDFGNVRNAYSDETGMSRVRTKPPNHPVGLLALRTPILFLHLCAEESKALKSTPASWCCLDRISPQVLCSAKANPFVKTCPEDNYRPWSCFICAAWNRWCGLPLNDVLGRIQGGVDPSTPGTLIAVVRRWKLELERLPVASEDAVHEHAFRR